MHACRHIPDTELAVQGGKAAAETVLDMREAGDYSALSCSQYERRWMAAYGHDFAWVRLDWAAELPRMQADLMSFQGASWKP